MNWTREFWCQNCKTKEPMNHKQVLDHLKSQHSLSLPLKGTRSATMFMDGKGFATQNYEWILGDVRLVEVATGRKSK